MKRKLQLLTMIPALVFSTGCDFSFFGGKEKQMEKVNVIVLSGQSNAVGCKAYSFLQTTMPDKYDEYLAGYEDVQIAFNNYTVDYMSSYRPKYIQNSSPKGKFTKVKLGQGNSAENFGPEVGIAEELHEKWGNKLYIIKIACGASCLGKDWSLAEDEMFVNLVKFVNSRMKDLEEGGLKPYLRAFCWMQGEGDSYEGLYQYYKDNLISLKNNLDRELLKYTEDNNLPFIDAGIGPGTHPDNTNEWQYYKEVNDAKKEFAELSPTNIYFDTIEAGLHSNKEPNDDVHYDSESQIQLGHLFAKNFEQFLK